MSEQNFSCSPGTVTPLTGALAAGATIINTSPTAAVWVSSNPNVGAGLGVRLGPKGSTTWTTDGAPVYACPDTGVTSAVTVTVSQDMAPPVNPVDVGVAVAAQLLQQGVPSVLVGEALIPANPGQYDVSGYASVAVTATFLGPCLFTYYYLQQDGGQQILYSRSFTIAAGVSSIQFTSAVAGPTLMITDGGSGMMSNRSVYASNRVLPDALANVSTTYQGGLTQAWTSGTAGDLPGMLYTNGGPHRLRLVNTGTSSGYLTAKVWNSNGSAMSDLVVADTNMSHTSPQPTAGIKELQEIIYLPPGVITFKFIPYTSATFQVIAHIVPVS